MLTTPILEQFLHIRTLLGIIDGENVLKRDYTRDTSHIIKSFQCHETDLFAQRLTRKRAVFSYPECSKSSTSHRYTLDNAILLLHPIYFLGFQKFLGSLWGCSHTTIHSKYLCTNHRMLPCLASVRTRIAASIATKKSV